MALRRALRRSLLVCQVIVTAALAQQPLDPVIETAREHAANFARSLPDYIVKRTTTRSQGTGDRVRDANGVRHYPSVKVTNWRTLDKVSATVAVENGKEVYSNISVNGKQAKALPTAGLTSNGEFATLMLEILSPRRGTVFGDRRADTASNRSAYRYEFVVDQAHSDWYIGVDLPAGRSIHVVPPFDGAIWLDKETGQVLRIEKSARGIGGGFPLDLAEAATDYDFVKIADNTFLLPVHTETVTCPRVGDICYRNETLFQDYSKFAASTNISFDSDTR